MVSTYDLSLCDVIPAPFLNALEKPVPLPVQMTHSTVHGNSNLSSIIILQNRKQIFCYCQHSGSSPLS